MKTEANARADTDDGPFYRGFLRWLASVEDGAVLRVAFFALLIGTASVLYLDYRELTAFEAAAPTAPLQPILPPADPDGPAEGTRPDITTSPEQLQAPLEIVLGSGGELRLTGSIDVGAAERFAAEIAARGEYVTTVLLDSPGGSVTDALAMGQLIREAGLDTRLAAGALCASSCPLVFASGVNREASPRAAIGVHQIYAMAAVNDPRQAQRLAGTAMADAQSTTGLIITHLTNMGVDPALWLHALQTPPDRLYYFSPEEMTALRLVTALTES